MSITKERIRERVLAGLQKAPKLAGDWGWHFFGMHITGEDDGIGERWWRHGTNDEAVAEGMEATQQQAKAAAVDSIVDHLAEMLEFIGDPIRARLADALGLTDPSDDELVEAAIINRTLAGGAGKALSDIAEMVGLTDAWAPEEVGEAVRVMTESAEAFSVLADRQGYSLEDGNTVEDAVHDLHADLTDLESYSCRGMEARAALRRPDIGTDHEALRADIQEVIERYQAAPALTAEPLPEGREGETLVVITLSRIGSIIADGDPFWSWSDELGGWALDGTLMAKAGTTGYRWSYVTRAEG